MQKPYRSGDRIRAAMAELVRRSRDSKKHMPGPLLRRSPRRSDLSEPVSVPRLARKPAGQEG